MGVWEIVLGIVLLVMSAVLITCVLMQSGKDKRLSGTIAGGAETFFGKEKGGRIDKILSRVTTVMGIVFVLLVLLVYVVQPGDYSTTSKNQSFENYSENIVSDAKESVNK